MSSDPLVRAGTAYMQNLAVANDGYAVITTGGANPSNVLLYSTTTHAFFTMNAAGANQVFLDADPRLYFGNPGVSADGATVVLTQDPRTAAPLPGSVRNPFFCIAPPRDNGRSFSGARHPRSLTRTARNFPARRSRQSITSPASRVARESW